MLIQGFALVGILAFGYGAGAAVIPPVVVGWPTVTAAAAGASPWPVTTASAAPSTTWPTVAPGTVSSTWPIITQE